MSKIKKTIAILLVVLFVVTVTASAVSAKDIKAHKMFSSKTTFEAYGGAQLNQKEPQSEQATILTIPTLRARYEIT